MRTDAHTCADTLICTRSCSDFAVELMVYFEMRAIEICSRSGHGSKGAMLLFVDGRCFPKVRAPKPPIFKLSMTEHDQCRMIFGSQRASVRYQSIGCPGAVATPVKIVRHTHYVTRVHRVPHPVTHYVQVPVKHVTGTGEAPAGRAAPDSEVG
jgi:hypothetical protein